MKAARFSKTTSDGEEFSPTDPPPPSAIYIQDGLPIPQVSAPGEMVVKVKATSVIRDNLSWPELFASLPAHLGNDFTGLVFETHEQETEFKVGDEVYGMTHADRGGAWAEYLLVTIKEAHKKPPQLSWEQAAAFPLSALTADQALFAKAMPDRTNFKGRRILITGATGGVGNLVVQFAAIVGGSVIAAASSISEQNRTLLRSFGAQEVIDYGQLQESGPFDIIIDTKGGSTLLDCWKCVKLKGAIVSIDSASWNFVAEHKEQKVPGWKESVRAIFFIVEPSRAGMERISSAVERGGVRISVGQMFPFSAAAQAYDLCQSGAAGRGKVVLVMPE